MCFSLSLLCYRKEQLMEKFQADNKSFSPERVEEEVDRFMMDAESVNMYIGYLKDRKSNPQKYANEALEAELSLSNPKTVSGKYLSTNVLGSRVSIVTDSYSLHLSPSLHCMLRGLLGGCHLDTSKTNSSSPSLLQASGRSFISVFHFYPSQTRRQKPFQQSPKLSTVPFSKVPT
jgi:hypothetical protein